MGCVELLNTVQRRVRPKLHVFGGIHEGKNSGKEFKTCYVSIHDLSLQLGITGVVVFKLFSSGTLL